MTQPRFTLPPVPQFRSTVALLIAAYSTPVLATLALPPASTQAVQAAAAHGVAEAAEQAPRYTCPMHPEVDSDKPGLCPHCGMKLEEKKTKAPKSGG
jgi:hypothetical protein